MDEVYKRDYIFMRDRHNTTVEKVPLADHHDPSLRADPHASELVKRMVAGWVEVAPPVETKVEE